MKIFLVGGLTVTDGHGARGVRQLGGPKPAQVLTALALAGGSAISKSRLADMLWDGRPPAEALATLESYVSLLRRRLGPAGRQVVVTVPGGYRLDSALAGVDVGEARTALRQQCRAEMLLGLARDVDGELVPDLPGGEWLVDARVEHARLVARVHRAGTRALLREAAATGVPRRALVDEAVQSAVRLTELDPLDEEGWELRMRALTLAGRRGEALAVFQRARRLLADELGSDPGPALRAALEAVLAQERAVTQPVGHGMGEGHDLDRAVAATVRLVRAIEEPGGRPTDGWMDEAVGVLTALLDRASCLARTA